MSQPDQRAKHLDEAERCLSVAIDEGLPLQGDWAEKLAASLAATHRHLRSLPSEPKVETGEGDELTGIGGFGVDPEDSRRLLELRQAIGDHLGWADGESVEAADYPGRIREVAAFLKNLAGKAHPPGALTLTNEELEALSLAVSLQENEYPHADATMLAFEAMSKLSKLNARAGSEVAETLCYCESEPPCTPGKCPNVPRTETQR